MFRNKLSAEIGKPVLGFGAADGNLALMIQDAPDAPPVVWKTPFQASYLDDLVKMATKTTETNAIGETGNPLKTLTTSLPGGDAKTTVEGDAEVAGRAQKFTAGIDKEVAHTNYFNAHTKGVEQNAELHGVQMDLAKEKLNQERLINSGRAKLAGGQLPTPDEYGALMTFEKQKQKEPKEDNLKAKDGLGVLEKHFSLDPEKLGPASAIYERYLKDGKNPMEAVSDTISMINGKTPIGRTPTVGEVIKGFQFIGGDPNDRNRWVKQGSQPSEDVRLRDNERDRLQQQAITDGPRATGEELLRQADAAVADAMQIINKPAPGSSGIASPQSARMEELRQFIASGKGSDEDKLNAQMEFLAMNRSNTPAQKNGAKSPSPEQIMQKKVATQEARIAELRQIIAAPTYIWHKGMVGNPKGAVLEERKLNAHTVRLDSVYVYAAECDLIHSRMASFTRVCQPLPDALSAASTSGSKRIVVGTLSGRAEGGRPMRTKGLTASHSSSVKGIASGSDIAAAVMMASSSGVGIIVPGLSFGIAFHLSGVGLAQADDTPAISTINEGHEE